MDDFERPFTIKLLDLQNISENPPARGPLCWRNFIVSSTLFCLNRIKVPTKSPPDIRKYPPRGPKWRARRTQVPRFLIRFIAFWAICLLPLAASLHCSLYTSLAFSIISCLFFTPKKRLFFKQVCAAALYVRAPFWAIFRRQKKIVRCFFCMQILALCFYGTLFMRVGG